MSTFSMFRHFNKAMLQSSLPKLVLILGSTGTGKSKLAIQLALKFNGEVISADSMQLYKGLDIVTNKVTQEEACGVPHHMISVLSPSTIGYTVQNFRDASLAIINDIWRRGRLPIVVGGTNYYIESLVWNMLVDDGAPECTEAKGLCNFSIGLPDQYLTMTNAELHAELEEIDPQMALVIHPNDRRKVLRSLQVWFLTGRKNSDFLAKQRQLPDGSVRSVGGSMRFDKTFAFWIQCDYSTLDRRLNQRVDEMVANGLKELLRFYEEYFPGYEKRLSLLPHAFGRPNGLAGLKGLFQCIGLKEFLPYLKSVRESEDDEELVAKHFSEGIARLKLATRQYARRQTQWINSRFLKKPSRQCPPVYALNGTDLAQWTDLVYKPAADILELLLENSVPRSKPLSVQLDPYEHRRRNLHTCDICSRVIAGAEQYESHVASKSHRKLVAAAKRRQLSKLSDTLSLTVQQRSYRVSRDVSGESAALSEPLEASGLSDLFDG